MPTVREFARLTLDPSPGSLDEATISSSAFQWLVAQARGGPSTPEFVRLEGPRSLTVLNYVGVLETPCGTSLEILPKHTDALESLEETRRLLVRMVMEALQLKPRDGTMSDIPTFKLPLPEWLASRFLQEASDLLRRGLRQDYQRVAAREVFMRGSLDVARQIRSGRRLGLARKSPRGRSRIVPQRGNDYGDVTFASFEDRARQPISSSGFF